MRVLLIALLAAISYAQTETFRQIGKEFCWQKGCDTIISEEGCAKAALLLDLPSADPQHVYSSEVMRGCFLSTESSKPKLIFNGNLNVVDNIVRSEHRASICNCTTFNNYPDVRWTWNFQPWSNESESFQFLSWEYFPLGGPNYFGYGGLALPSINPRILDSQGETIPVYGGANQLTFCLALFQNHWEIPLTAIALYTLMITFGPKLIPRKMKPAITISMWNFTFSAFSSMGFLIVFPKILFGRDFFSKKPIGWLNGGSFYDNICSDAAWYADGTQGLWVVAFILSKLPELIDTFWLLLGKHEVIFLHWYHHISVLLFCWHAFAERISLGIHFCLMNYLVHGVMYFYFGMTQWSLETRKIVKPYAIWVTLLQLAQMVGGIFLVCSTYYFKHVQGLECHQSDANMMAAFIMYSSYFVLFAQLFYSRYDIVKKVLGAKNKAA